MVWIGSGMAAAMQRNHFMNTPVDCGHWGTIAVTVAAGPLNYLGANPKVTECQLPEPSQ
ncbi:hypothetical protein [Nocardia sp. NPDC058497]|uniref:hypothetical protein n=1 Tax=Nocardia sp. NPDC058497 TaxID=3346529 RepID=UPI00366672A6